MAIPVYQIGPHAFIGTEGKPDTIRTQLGIITRDGVAGVGFRDTGKRGVPFTLRTTVDLATDVERFTKLAEYEALIDSDPVKLIWGDHEMELVRSSIYQVTDVREVWCGKIGASAGGMHGPSVAVLVCDWDLVAVAKASE